MTQSDLTAADRRLTLAALAIVVLLSALDQTIVATAMPRIIEDLQGLPMYAWVTTAYMLTSTVTVPIYGKLGDQFGRKPVLVCGVVLFLVGSALCGLAGEYGELPLLGGGMMQLIVFRALQGLGAGALMTISFAIMADMYQPRERGRLFGVFGSVFGLATVVGPFIGGFFTDHGATQLLGYEIAGWRWVFYVNLPLGLAALLMIAYRLPQLPRGSGGRIDYLGALLVVLTATPILLALSLGGVRYGWTSPAIVGLALVACAAFIAFLKVEQRAEHPLIPLHLFRERTFRRAALASCVMSMAFLGVVMFMPLYMQVVQGVSATESGVALLPLMGAMIVTSILTGRIVARVGRYKPFMIFGAVTLFIGVASLAGIDADTSPGDLTWRLALTGFGLGPAQTLFSLVIQNAAPQSHVGVATSMSQFSRQMGATVGVALFGAFLMRGLTEELPKHTPALPGVSAPSIDLANAQSQAMRVDEVRARVHAALGERYALIARAYDGDAFAAATILADSRLPAQLKDSVRDGGVRARVHEQVSQQAAMVEQELRAGIAGRERLLNDAQLSPLLRRRLADIPSRAFDDQESMERIAILFRDAVLAKEQALADAAVERALQTVRAAMDVYEQRMVEQIQRGTRVAFATAIAHMLERALWIIALALGLVLLIPELPLRSRGDPI